MLNKLTIVLTVRGRDHYTPRFLEVLNSKIPYGQKLSLFLAEHTKDPVVTELCNAGSYPNLLLRRQSYGECSLTDYYKKVSHSIRQVHTPYVMLCDNDDLPQLHGILDCIKFLEKNGDYVGCIGNVISFYLFDLSFRPSLRGPVGFTGRHLAHLPSPSFESQCPRERITGQLREGASTHYAVFRTSTLSLAWDSVSEISPPLVLVELFVTLRILIFGKFKFLSSVTSYARQKGTSQQLGYSHSYQHMYWTRSFNASVPRIYRNIMRVCRSEGISLTLDFLERGYAEHYARHIPLPKHSGFLVRVSQGFSVKARSLIRFFTSKCDLFELRRDLRYIRSLRVPSESQ